MRLLFWKRKTGADMSSEKPETSFQLIPTVNIPYIEKQEDNAPVVYFGDLGSGDSVTPEEALQQSFESSMEVLGYTRYDTDQAEIRDLDLSRLDDLMSRLSS